MFWKWPPFRKFPVILLLSMEGGRRGKGSPLSLKNFGQCSSPVLAREASFLDGIPLGPSVAPAIPSARSYANPRSCFVEARRLFQHFQIWFWSEILGDVSVRSDQGGSLPHQSMLAYAMTSFRKSPIYPTCQSNKWGLPLFSVSPSIVFHFLFNLSVPPWFSSIFAKFSSIRMFFSHEFVLLTSTPSTVVFVFSRIFLFHRLRLQAQWFSVRWHALSKQLCWYRPTVATAPVLLRIIIFIFSTWPPSLLALALLHILPQMIWLCFRSSLFKLHLLRQFLLVQVSATQMILLTDSERHPQFRRWSLLA